MLMQTPAFDGAPGSFEVQAKISARLERLPVTRQIFWLRNIIGAATFFDGYTVLAIAYAMPVLVREWKLTPSEVGMIISFGISASSWARCSSVGWQNGSAVYASCSSQSWCSSRWILHACSHGVRGR